MRSCYNVTTLFFTLSTVLVCLVTSLFLSNKENVPTFLAPSTEIVIPTMQAAVIWTPSSTPRPTNTRLPSVTPSPSPTWTSTPTQTATVTNTPLPTSTATITSTATPSSTFTQTFTPTIPPTITLTPTATGPTATPPPTSAPFPFEVPVLNGGLRVRQEPNNNCNYQGFAGNAFDLFNAPVNGLQVVVTGAGLPQSGAVASSGSNNNFGPGGWEVVVSNNLNTFEYTLQLRGVDGTALSAPIDFTFTGNCQQNQVLIRFQQIKPY